MEKERFVPGRDDKVKLIAHRGFTPFAPQNSLPSFLEAGRRKFWAIETDVRRTADGHLVCIHDATIDSLYLGSGAVAEMTIAELRRMVRKEIETKYPELYAGGGEHCWSAEELYVPMYSQYLHICRACEAVPFVELKTGDVTQVMEETAHYFREEEVVMSSGTFAYLEQVRKLTDKTFVHHIFSNEDCSRTLSQWGRAGHSYNYPNLDDVPEGLIERDHELGVCVCLRAGDTPEQVRRMVEMGLDYVPTNLMAPSELN